MEIRLLEKPVQLSQKKTGKKLYVHLDPNSQDWLTWFQAVTIHIFKRRRVGQKYNQVFNFKIFYLSQLCCFTNKVSSQINTRLRVNPRPRVDIFKMKLRPCLSRFQQHALQHHVLQPHVFCTISNMFLATCSSFSNIFP